MTDSRTRAGQVQDEPGISDCTKKKELKLCWVPDTTGTSDTHREHSGAPMVKCGTINNIKINSNGFNLLTKNPWIHLLRINEQVKYLLSLQCQQLINIDGMMDLENQSLTPIGTWRKGRFNCPMARHRLSGAQWHAKSCFSTAIQLPAADGMTLLQNPRGLCYDSPTEFAINSTLHFFLTTDTTKVCWITRSKCLSGLLTPKLATVPENPPALGPIQSWQPSMFLGIGASIVPSCGMPCLQKEKRPTKCSTSLW